MGPARFTVCIGLLHVLSVRHRGLKASGSNYRRSKSHGDYSPVQIYQQTLSMALASLRLSAAVR